MSRMWIFTILSALIFTLVCGGEFMHEDLRRHLCDNNGTFQGEFLKCLKSMPKEIQTVIINCGSRLLNETSCEYRKIIEETCADPDYGRNVSLCVKDFLGHHHNLKFDEDEEEGHDDSELHHKHHDHDHSEHHHSQHDHDHSEHHHSHHDHDHDDEDDHAKKTSDDEVEDPSLHKDCLTDLYSSYNITFKEEEEEESTTE